MIDKNFDKYANKIVYVFLSNRTYPTMENKLLSEYNVRTEIQRIIYESLNISK